MSEFETADIDADAFREIFDKHHYRIYAFFVNRGFTPDESHDLVQETFMAVFSGRKGFRGDSSFDTWLYSIAMNVWKRALRDLYRAKRKGDELPLDDPRKHDEIALQIGANEVEKTAEEAMIKGERSVMLRQAIDQLPEKMAQCLRLRLDHDLKYSEIAQAMQTTVSDVKSQLFQARAKLKRYLRPSELTLQEGQI